MSQQIEVPELGFVGLLRYSWRQLTSMRTALTLLSTRAERRMRDAQADEVRRDARARQPGLL